MHEFTTLDGGTLLSLLSLPYHLKQTDVSKLYPSLPWEPRAKSEATTYSVKNTVNC